MSMVNFPSIVLDSLEFLRDPPLVPLAQLRHVVNGDDLTDWWHISQLKDTNHVTEPRIICHVELQHVFC